MKLLCWGWEMLLMIFTCCGSKGLAGDHGAVRYPDLETPDERPLSVHKFFACMHQRFYEETLKIITKVRKKRCFPGAPSSSISVAMRGSCTGLWANRRFLLTAWAGGIWLSKRVWFKGLSWYPASNFQQVPITVLHLPARMMGQMQFLCALCSCSTGNIAKLGPELPTSPRIYMLAWKYGGISAPLGSRFASVTQSLFCCSSWNQVLPRHRL